VEEEILAEEEDLDLELLQYYGRRVTNKNGFTSWVLGRDIADLLPEKQFKVRELLRGQDEGEELEEIEENEGGGPVTEMTLYCTCGESLYDIFEEKRIAAENTIESVEGVYFMYKFKRNIWRSKQKSGSNLLDEAFRKACRLLKHP
jgi:hypothetical protein